MQLKEFLKRLNTYTDNTDTETTNSDSEDDSSSPIVDMYNLFYLDEKLPIEIVVQMCLLKLKKRLLVQFDHYVYNEEQWNYMNNWMKQQTNFFFHCTNKESLKKPDVSIPFVYMSSKKNILVFMSDNEGLVKDIIEKDSLEDVLGKYLDAEFYGCCAFGYEKKDREDIVRVSIDVMGPVVEWSEDTGSKVPGLMKTKNYAGQLLLMECNDEEMNPSNLQKIYKKFLEYKSFLRIIDPKLQISLEFYAKNSGWEKQPFLRTLTCHPMN